MDALPVMAVLDELRAALLDRGVAVLVAPPGTGKTTAVPPELLDEPWCFTPGARAGRIVVVEPRRLAARSAAERMAERRGESPGRTVGWSIRGDRRVSGRTRIEVVTGGVLLRRLQTDPGLAGTSAVLLDEFHERSVDDDLLLALLLDVRSSLRSDLRLVVMSATIEAASIARLLGAGSRPAPVVTATAPLHPVTTDYRPATGHDPLERRVAAVVSEALDGGPGDVLVFLPGRREIRRTRQELEPVRAGVVVLELHGGIRADQQDAALRPDPDGRRRVILATSVAETSITVAGVGVVVDSGRRRTVRVHPGTGLPGLVTEPVSIAGADQRRGRAGRSGPGRCFRLWSTDEERHRPTADRPEVLDADLAPMLLQVTAWGATVDDLTFPDRPSPAHLAAARTLLVDLGAIDTDGRLTRRGRRLTTLGFHPRLGAVVLAAMEERSTLGADGAAEIAAILESDLPGEIDLVERVRSARLGDAPRDLRDAAREWRRRLDASGSDLDVNELLRDHPEPDDPDLDRAVALAVVAGYGDRLAKRRDSARTDGRGRRIGVFQMVGGGEIALDGRDTTAGPLTTTRWLAVVSLDRAGAVSAGSAAGAGVGRAHLVVAVPDDIATEALAARSVTDLEVGWDPSRREPVATESRRVGAITLERRPWREPPAQELRRVLLGAVRDHGPSSVFDRWPEADELLHRLALAGQVDGWADAGDNDDGDAGAPSAADRKTDQAVEHLVDRLVSSGGTGRAALAEVDVATWILEDLSWSERSTLDRSAPTHLELVSGRRVRVRYTVDGPEVSTRLQDLLGTDAHPSVANGRVPVVVQLLSPAGRPLQRTSDLPAFWRGSYASVRAEMRGRYPKHPWPERPWEPL